MSAPLLSTPLSRAHLMSLTPTRYLQAGFRAADGSERPELTTLWALAAAEQLLAARVSPEQVERLRQEVRRQAADCYQVAEVREALVGEALRGPSGLRPLLQACTGALLCWQDVDQLARHLEAVARLLALKRAITVS